MSPHDAIQQQELPWIEIQSCMIADGSIQLLVQNNSNERNARLEVFATSGQVIAVSHAVLKQGSSRHT